jgi:MFS family permease
LGQELKATLGDPRFRPLLRYTILWNFGVNLAAPFFAIYFIQQLGIAVQNVVVLWAVSQLANMLTLGSWGRLSDRLSNKAILGVAAPMFLGAMLALPFAALPERHVLTLPLLGLIHIVMGAGAAAIGLASGNLTLKIAPAGRATGHLACIGLAGSIAAGIAPIIGGALGAAFASVEFGATIHFSVAGIAAEFPAVQLRHWDFLFAIAFTIGLGAVYSLSLVEEGPEVQDKVVVQAMLIEARRALRSLSSVGGLRIMTSFLLGTLTSTPRPPSRSNLPQDPA